MRWLKPAAWIAGGAALLLVAAAAALWFGGGPVVAWVVEEPLSAYLGRHIQIDGPLTVRWGAPTRLVAENVRVANASWGSRPAMFTAKRLEIDLFVRTLIHGRVRIPLIRLDGADLLLETSPQGQGNWRFTTGAPKHRGQFPDLERFVVGRSTLTWHNGRTGAATRLGIDNLGAAAPGRSTPVYIQASGSVAGTFGTLPLRVAGRFGSLNELYNPTKPYAVTINGRAGPIDVAIDGAIARPLDFAGVDLRLSLSGQRLDELAAVLGVPMPALPNFRGTSVFKGGNGQWSLTALTLALGNSDLEGGLTIDTNDKVPYVRANLTASHIDLADFKGLAGGTPSHAAAPAKPPDASGRIFPDTSLDVRKLPGLNADVAFYGTRITSTSGLPFDAVYLDLELKNGGIVVKPLRFRTANGDFDLTLNFTPFTTSSPPRLGAEIDIHHIDLHRLLAGSASSMIRETGGIVGGFLKAKTTGTSLRQFMARMNGDAGIFMQHGQLSDLLQNLAPINVLTSLTILATGDRPVPIDCLVARFGIRQGVATASTLLVGTADAVVTGAGTLNLGDETIHLKLTPHNKGFQPLSLRAPIDVGGTFAHRTYNIETAGLIARLGTAIGLGVLFPPAALLPLIDTGLGNDNACSNAFAARPADEGSSRPPR